MKRKPSLAAHKGLVAEWADVPIGTPVEVTKDDGSVVATKTRSTAQMLSGHSAVIWLEGIAGCYLLNRVKKTPPTPNGDKA